MVFNNQFAINQDDRNKAIGKEFLKMETRFRKKELHLVVTYDAKCKLIGASFFKIENNGTEIFVESLFFNNIHDAEFFKFLYHEMVAVMGQSAPNAIKIRIKARTIPQLLEPALKDCGLKYYSDKREWVHEANDQHDLQVTQPWYSPFISFIPLPNIYNNQ